MLKHRKEGKLPPFMGTVNPPGYKKKAGRRTLWAVLRKDQYRIEGGKLVLKGLGAIRRVELRYKGVIHLRGEQGRLEIRYDPDRKRWYAHIPSRFARKRLEGSGLQFQSDQLET